MQICSVKYQLLFCKKLFYENTAPGSRFDIQVFAGAGRVRLSIILAGILESLFIPFTSIFLLAILTPVNLILFICKNKNLIQSLLDGSDAARILAFDHVDNLLRKTKVFLLNNLLVLDDVYGDVVIDDDMFEADTEGYKQQEKKRLSKRTRVSLFLLLVAIPLTIAAGFWLTDQSALADWIDRVFGPRKYYLISLVIVLYALLPFFMAFEGRKPEVRELVVLATMIALATAGRAAFFMTPSFKPIIAIVIISAIAFGAEAGFLVGSMTMLVSNFLFGQGPWTPWQMFAMGFIGFLSGILYRLRILPTKRLQLSVYGFLVTFMIYGGIMNPAALFMSVYQFSWSGLLAIYISGVPVDLVHASSTFLFLWIGAKPLLEKLQRIKVKYGLL